jgi:hypothetical protein
MLNFKFLRLVVFHCDSCLGLQTMSVLFSIGMLFWLKFLHFRELRIDKARELGCSKETSKY